MSCVKNFNGNVLFLNRSDINTDEIIPARYLTEISKSALKPFLLEDLNLEGFDAQTDLADKQVIVTRDNFGCGSSREQAPLALKSAGVAVVVANYFARIFYRNAINIGLPEGQEAEYLHKLPVTVVFNRSGESKV